MKNNLCCINLLSVAISTYLSLEHYDHSDDFKVSLPAPLNFNLPSPSIVLRIALFIIPISKYCMVVETVTVCGGMPGVL